MRFLSVTSLWMCLLLLPFGVMAADNEYVFPKGIVTIHTRSGDMHRFNAEIAATPRLRARGYMFRTYIPPMTGMFFIFPDEQHRSFWMRNTPSPLDLVFVRASGEIAHIIHNAKPMNDDALPSTVPAQYVLEVYAGTTERLGIAAGDRLSFKTE